MLHRHRLVLQNVRCHHICRGCRTLRVTREGCLHYAFYEGLPKECSVKCIWPRQEVQIVRFESCRLLMSFVDFSSILSDFDILILYKHVQFRFHQACVSLNISNH